MTSEGPKWPQLFWLTALLFVIPASVLPWAHKEMFDRDCLTEWNGQSIETVCEEHDWVVDYRLFSMETDHTSRHLIDGAWTEPFRLQFAFSYGDAEGPNPEGVTPMLQFGGALFALSALASAVALVVHVLRPVPATMMAGRIAWIALATSIALFLTGLGIHAGTWSGDEFSRLTPRWGLLPAIAPLLMGIPFLPERRQAPAGMPDMPSYS